MGKEINEKTFELNITNELLNASKSIFWYINFSPFHSLFPESTIRELLNQHVLFAEGLTQSEESRLGGGYDVSININNPLATDKRIMFLQFKSGRKKNFRRNNTASIFHQSKKPEPHVEFDFNDAADQNQHIILRELANQPNIQTDSVMYVFPRITERSDFHSKIGNLIWHSSFIPVVDIDRQGSQQDPPILITSGVPHKYRTSYDGLKSEVNLLLFLYLYDNFRIGEILGEMMCVQMERLLKSILSDERRGILDFIRFFKENSRFYFNAGGDQIFLSSIVYEILERYLDECINAFKERGHRLVEEFSLPKAPSKYTTRLPERGINLNFQRKMELESIQYQIF